MKSPKLAPNVRLIPANPLKHPSGRPKSQKLRVAAYCRVSTDDSDQLNSYEAQVNYYTQKIEDSDEWEMAGIFADEGITGTSTHKRMELKRMLALCRRGKIDMILCKSVSRLTRNTLDCVSIARELKALGIPIIFEKENINTILQQSEFILTLYGSFAQAESESISANVRWGKRKSMQDGKVIFQYSRLLGYRKGADGKPEIVPDEAATVMRIYTCYLAGYSLGGIKAELEAEGVPTASGIKGWSYQVIQNILTNERYIGDALLQKTYREDCLSKTTRKNNGELPQYYVEDNHPAIVPKELYYQVGEEMARRANKRKVTQKSGKTGHGKFSSIYALSERLICGECGTPYRRCTWARNGVKRIVWRCISRLESGTTYCKKSPTMDESKLHGAILRAMNQAVMEKEQILETLRLSTTVALGGGTDTAEPERIRLRIVELDAELMENVKASLKPDADTDAFNTRIKEITEETALLRQKLKEYENKETILQNNDARLREAIRAIESALVEAPEYDDALTARLVERVTVKDANTICVQIKDGVEITATL